MLCSFYCLRLTVTKSWRNSSKIEKIKRTGTFNSFDFTITDTTTDYSSIRAFSNKEVTMIGGTFAIGNGVSIGPLTLGNLSIEIPNSQVDGLEMSISALKGKSTVSNIKMHKIDENKQTPGQCANNI